MRRAVHTTAPTPETICCFRSIRRIFDATSLVWTLRLSIRFRPTMAETTMTAMTRSTKGRPAHLPTNAICRTSWPRTSNSLSPVCSSTKMRGSRALSSPQAEVGALTY